MIFSTTAEDMVRQVVGTAHLSVDGVDEREARMYRRMRQAVVPCLGCGAEHLAVDLSVGDALCPGCRCHGPAQDLSNTNTEAPA